MLKMLGMVNIPLLMVHAHCPASGQFRVKERIIDSRKNQNSLSLQIRLGLNLKFSVFNYINQDLICKSSQVIFMWIQCMFFYREIWFRQDKRVLRFVLFLGKLPEKCSQDPVGPTRTQKHVEDKRCPQFPFQSFSFFNHSAIWSTSTIL